MLPIPPDPPPSSAERAALERPASPTLSYFLMGLLWFLTGCIICATALMVGTFVRRPALYLWHGEFRWMAWAWVFFTLVGLLGELLLLGGLLFWVVGFARLWTKKGQETSKIPKSITWACIILIFVMGYSILATLHFLIASQCSGWLG
jgi:hypothetical protein